MKILCIGDSLTYGAWDSRGGWVARLRERIDRVCLESDLATFVLTYNLGIDYDTTETARARFGAELAAHRTLAGDGLIISLGTNDSVWLRSEERHWVDIEAYERNIRSMVGHARRGTDRIVLLGTPPVDENKTLENAAQPDMRSSNSDIRRYEQTAERVAEDLGVTFVPVFEPFSSREPLTLLHPDGIHPNDAGHALIADLLWPAVEGWVKAAQSFEASQ